MNKRLHHSVACIICIFLNDVLGNQLEIHEKQIFSLPAKFHNHPMHGFVAAPRSTRRRNIPPYRLLPGCTEALKGHRVLWKIEICYVIRMT